jgi:hypothetical protein
MRQMLRALNRNTARKEMKVNTESKSVPRKTNHRVTQSQFYALCKWLENKENIEGVKTYADVAARAAKAFPDLNCYEDGMRRAWITVGLPPLNQVVPVTSDEAAVILARAFVDLCNRLGEPVSPAIMTLASGERPTITIPKD